MWAIAYEDHFPQYWYPDPEHPLAQVHKWLRETIRGARIDISSTTDDMAYANARVSAPRLPLVYFYVDVKKRLPLIVMVHGGPYGIYDTWASIPKRSSLRRAATRCYR